MRKPLALLALFGIAVTGCRGGGAPVVPFAPSASFITGDATGRNVQIVLAVTGSIDPQGIKVGVFRPEDVVHPVVTVVGDVANKSKLCSKTTGTRNCAIPTVLRDSSSYTFEIMLYDLPPRHGKIPTSAKVLGGGGVISAISSKITRINLTTNSALARAGIAFEPAAVHSMNGGKFLGLVTGYDSSGNAIASNAFTSGSKKVAVALSADKASAPVLTFPASARTPLLSFFTVAYDATKATGPQVADGFTASMSAKSAGATTGTAKLTILKPHATEAKVPTANSFPQAITMGSDGAIYFCEYNTTIVGRLTTDMRITNEYGIGFQAPQSIVSGPDGALWIANWSGAGGIARLSVHGGRTQYALPVNTYPAGISVGPDKKLWFGSVMGNYLTNITTGGVLGKQTKLPAGNNYPFFSAPGPNKSVYFTLNGTGEVAQVTELGTLAKIWKIPGTNAYPENIILGPDKLLWLTDIHQNAIFSMTANGVFKKYALPKSALPTGPLAFGPDGKLWYGSLAGIGRLDPSTGAVIAIALPSGDGYGLVDGTDRAFYITEPSANKIARLQ